MKIKRTTIDRYNKFKAKAKKSSKFIMNGVAYSQAEFETLIGHKPAEIAPVVEKPINTVAEEDYADLERKDDSGDTEES